jgi:hypothetical protein
LCVADFWETEQRRAISTFTSPVKVDTLLLVTTTKPLNTDSMFQFPNTFSSDRLVPLRNARIVTLLPRGKEMRLGGKRKEGVDTLIASCLEES